MSEMAGDPLLSVPQVRDRLDSGQRDQFDAELRALLSYVRLSYDLDAAQRLLRRWWLQSGGEVAVAERDEEVWHRFQYPTGGLGMEWIIDLFPRSGPVVAAKLTGADRELFDGWWSQAVVEAGDTLDLIPLRGTLSQGWLLAEGAAHPDHQEELKQRAAAVRAAADAGDLSGYEIWEE